MHPAGFRYLSPIPIAPRLLYQAVELRRGLAAGGHRIGASSRSWGNIRPIRRSSEGVGRLQRASARPGDNNAPIRVADD